MSVYLEHGLMCPQCYGDSSLVIDVRTTVELTSAGSIETGSHDWDDDSDCQCVDCGHYETVKGFRPTSDPVDTAMCLWEAALETPLPKDLGAAEFRGRIRDLVPDCDETYNFALTLGYDRPFDWDFCPWFVKICGETQLRPDDWCILLTQEMCRAA